MNESITISIPKRLKRTLDRERKAKGISRSSLVVDALQRYLTIQKLEDLREKMIPRARAQGIYTDEDVFSRVS
ncbi:MAG: ribbon-helix-helix protein, CopG family [Candidatus Kapaibacterium sp.]